MTDTLTGRDASTDRSPSRSARGSYTPVMAVVGACAALVAAIRPIADNSVLTHLATGRLIIDGGLPSENPFLYSSTDFPVPSWWWSTALASAESLGGTTGLRLLVALVAGLFGATLVLLAAPPPAAAELEPAQTESAPAESAQTGSPESESAGSESAGPGGRLLEVLVPSGLAGLAVVEFLGARPHLVSFLLLALTLAVVVRRWSPWWLAPIFAVWINVHGTWTYGLVVLVLVSVGRCVDRRRVTRNEVWTAAAALGGTLVGALLYPERFELLLLPARQFGDPLERAALQTYNEWARPGLGTAMLWPMLALGGLAVWGAWRERRHGSLGVSLVLILIGVSSIRMIPIAAVTLVPFAAAALRGVGSLSLPTGAAARRVLIAAGVVAAVAVVACAGRFDPPASVDGYDLGRFSVDGLDQLDDAGLIAPDVRLLTTIDDGNYLAWRFGASANAFVDDRPGAAALVDYRRMLREEPDMAAAFDRAAPDVVLWPTDSGLVDELDTRGWQRITEYGKNTLWCSAALAARCAPLA